MRYIYAAILRGVDYPFFVRYKWELETMLRYNDIICVWKLNLK